MKLALEMAVMDMGDEVTAVAVGEDSAKFRGMLRLNSTAADIVRLLANDITQEQLEETLRRKYDESAPAEVHEFVNEFLEQLRREGLLAE